MVFPSGVDFIIAFFGLARIGAVAMPFSTLAMPREALMPSALPTLGRRRSASIRITRLPASASEAARLSAVVVLPSEGEAPVIRTARGMSSLPRRAVSVARSVR